MLGVSLVLVGIVLVHNGILFMSKDSEGAPLIATSGKSIAFFNAIVGSLLILLNLIWLATGAQTDLANDYAANITIWQNIASGLLFGITYLFVAGNILFKMDMRPFGIFCLGASGWAVVSAADSFIAYSNGWSHGLWLGLLWIAWFLLWFAGVLQFTFKIKKMENIFPWISITVGIVGAFLPAVLLLTGTWGLL